MTYQFAGQLQRGVPLCTVRRRLPKVPPPLPALGTLFFLAVLVATMADEERGGGGAWGKVPTWDGSPLTWRSFRREMSWWLSSLDLESTKRYNLAARWLLRQTGIVRQRGEEFSPEELAYKPAETLDDPDTGETYQISEPDYLAGLNKLLKALESINGQTTLDKRGELRTEFYLELHRRAGERVSEFCTRFRSLVADLRAEGVALPEGELGWFLKEKLGLDGLRKQLLETALQGREAYDVIEAETLRLFKDLHVSDPMRRRFDRPKLTVRRIFGGPSNASTAPSSAWSSAASTRTASSMASSRPNLGPRRFPAARTLSTARRWSSRRR